ncbi:hypothetical protein B0H14DRAFT_2668939 [Mycena olivaceomarginata]|nr:hypothetical protein B0H14DRAFT_2668939 [Mycena olivaceomarginata]
MARKKWYVVTVGREVGVFDTWIEVSPLVTGVSGALHQSFSSESEANDIFARAQDAGKTKIVGTTATSTATSHPPSPRLHAERPPAAVDPGRQHSYSPSARPLATPTAASRSLHSARSSTLDLPGPLKSEVIEGASTSASRVSSPPTGEAIVLSSGSESAVLSPLDFRENSDDGSELPAQTGSSSHASSNLPSPPHAATSASAQVSSNDNTLPPVTINVVHHIHHHYHHHTHRNDASEHDLNGREDNLNYLSSQMADLGLSQEDNHVSRATDPRSPLRQPGSVPPIS